MTRLVRTLAVSATTAALALGLAPSAFAVVGYPRCGSLPVQPMSAASTRPCPPVTIMPIPVTPPPVTIMPIPVTPPPVTVTPVRPIPVRPIPVRSVPAKPKPGSPRVIVDPPAPLVTVS